MAVNAYLKIKDRPGPSQSKAECIDILSFSWGCSMQSTYGAGSSGSESRSGRADLANLTIMKVLDKTSPLLFDDCVTGNILEEVDLYYDKPMGDKQEDYFKLHLQDALITSVQLSGSSENPVESVSFAYEKIKVSYNPESDEGKLQGFIDKGFDTSKLVPW
jgi:type VI secretion system secreted protein Hcp